MAEPVQGISAVPDDGNSRYFHVVVSGPEDVREYTAISHTHTHTHTHTHIPIHILRFHLGALSLSSPSPPTVNFTTRSNIYPFFQNSQIHTHTESI